MNERARISVRLPEPMVATLRQIATEEERTLTQIIERLLKQGLGQKTQKRASTEPQP
jgi:hypothetical protein